MRRLFILLALPLIATPVLAEPLIEPPFVGCPSDGQTGPEKAPAKALHVPRLPAATAARLSFYQAGETVDHAGLLGPRGWHCEARYGSNGYSLILSPRPLNEKSTTGPAIQFSNSSSETSGRFEVADLAPRYFPATIPFARRLAAEQLPLTIVTHPYPADSVMRRSPLWIDYRTAAMRKGLGTRSFLLPGAQPISGFLMIASATTPDMNHLAIRLYPRDQDLVTVIRDAAARRAGATR